MSIESDLAHEKAYPELFQPHKAGFDALMLALHEMKPEDVLLPLIPGSDLHHHDHQGKTALISAVEHREAGVVKALLAGSDVRHQDNRGKTALMWAVIRQDKECLALLLPLSDLGQQDKKGRTALITAAGIAHDGILDMLLTIARGKHFQQQDEDGKNAWQMARSKGKSDNERLLQTHERLILRETLRETVANVEMEPPKSRARL